MGGLSDDAARALSAARWWLDAGVDALVDESPRNWLAPAVASVRTAPAPVPAEAPGLPETLAALTAWLADPQTFPALGSRRFAPTGDPAAGLMLVSDMPERDDTDTLLAGTSGRLLDAMLGAIGRDRASVYLAPLAPGRPAGRPDRAIVAELAAAMRRHVALARPRLVLLLGELPATALLGQPFAAARGRLHQFNHGEGTVPALATFHPRFLLDRPACKADAWADLRLLLKELGQ